MMDLIIIPFHDWRKSEKEGFRTRDVHMIKALEEHDEVRQVLVINRPVTRLELWIKKFSKNLRGTVVLEKGRFRLTRVRDHLYVTDYFSPAIMQQVRLKHGWFFEVYAQPDYMDFIRECRKYLGMQETLLLNQNVFAFQLASQLESDLKVFDAWDNFLKFPAYHHLGTRMRQAYETLAQAFPRWTTNSQENLKFYRDQFQVQEISMVKNGVKSDFGEGMRGVPPEMQNLPKPIIGFGGKISYLMDVGLINTLTATHSNASFVFVGQVLDKTVYANIEKRANVHFIQDKPYEEYPLYVKNFDIGIVPYHTGEKQHGGDSMKAYEYLVAGLKVVGTWGNGLEDLQEYIYVCRTAEEFSRALADPQNARETFPSDQFSWHAKAHALLMFAKHGKDS